MFTDYALPFIVVFGIVTLVYLVCHLCLKKRLQPDFSQAQAQVQQGVEQIKGIDQQTIDSYPTVVIGENNGKMLELDEKICPICLCEYDEKDILKILPECLHRFHRDCLVQWLNFNDTCPVCRTHPPRF